MQDARGNAYAYAYAYAYACIMKSQKGKMFVLKRFVLKEGNSSSR